MCAQHDTAILSSGETLRPNTTVFLLIPAMRADEEGSCPLEFWREESKQGRFKLLSQVAKLVYAPSIAPTASGRIFSAARARA